VVGLKNVFFLLWIALTCFGCGEGSSSSVDPVQEYPVGPYGLEVGDVVENVTLETHDGDALSFANVRATGASAMVIFNTAGWCARCAECMPELMAIHDRFAARGLVTMVSILQSRQYGPASVRDAAYFRRAHELGIPVLADKDAVLEHYFPRLSLPMVMIVDLDTMTLLSAEMMFDPEGTVDVLGTHFGD